MTARLIMVAFFLLGAFSPTYAADKATKIISGDEIALADVRSFAW